ncbi:uncharacterized protein [Nicotiana sylvestris]|uniref:uncharacterized protein n=1 Tax=Nicotiana sylvestris TaxID=4096 RepID=UPI00388CE771
MWLRGGGRKELVEKEVSDGLDFSCTEDKKDDDGEKEEEAVNIHEKYDAQNIDNEEEKSENDGVYRDEKESDTEDKTGEQANKSAEEENQNEEEEASESEGEDQEKLSESERVDDESEEEGNVSDESKGSMTIGNTVVSPSEEIGEKTRAQETGSMLTPFTGDEEVSSDEDDMPLSDLEKKSRKTTVEAIKIVVSTRKGVVPPARTPLTRSKRKVVDAQIIKELRSAKKTQKKVPIEELVVEVDGEDESDSALPAKSATPKKKGAKVTRLATSSTRASRGKTRNNVLAAVDRIKKFKNRKMLNGKILTNTDKKGMGQLVEKLELQGWKHMFVKAFPLVFVPGVVVLYKFHI